MTELPSFIYSHSEAPCSHCREDVGVFRFPNTPGLFCPTCALLLRKMLADGRTWPELVAELIKE